MDRCLYHGNFVEVTCNDDINCNNFDRVHYGKLFNILLYKKVPFVIIRLLLDAYIRQEAMVMWNSCKSQYFCVKNGVN